MPDDHGKEREDRPLTPQINGCRATTPPARCSSPSQLPDNPMPASGELVIDDMVAASILYSLSWDFRGDAQTPPDLSTNQIPNPHIDEYEQALPPCQHTHPLTPDVLVGATLLHSLSRDRRSYAQEQPDISTKQDPEPHAKELQQALLSRRHTYDNALEYGLEENAFESMSDTADSSRTTIEDDSERPGQKSPIMKEQEATENGVPRRVPSPLGSSSRQLRRSASPITAHEQDQQSVSLISDKISRPKSSKQNNSVTIEELAFKFKDKKALVLWVETEKRKPPLSWPQLEEGQAFVKNMARDELDPQKLQRCMKEDDKEKRARKTSRVRLRRHPTTASKKRTLVGSKRKAPPTASREDKPSTTPAKIPRPSKASFSTPTKQIASLTVSQDVEVPSTPASNGQLTPAGVKQPDVPPSTPVKKRRRMVADELETSLGESWKPSVTNDGHRPCSRRQTKP